MQTINVLIVEEFRYIADLNVLELKRGGYSVCSRYVSSELAMCQALLQEKWDIILSDDSTPHFNAIQALSVRNRLTPKTPFIIVSEDVAPESIRYAMKNRCCAYLLKENLHQLAILVRKILESQSTGQIQKETSL
ncbi:response regulator [Clostridium sp. KNHs216]|jgi:FOG: CheY-like receiver|uniref:response regulator n=1 Tax=Eubacteriales TaxID=186802 RepID=UPI00056F9DE6|nr:response regulator [Clostridium sp. KNHs216]MBE6831526.1 response regulator [Oscillospiraceae bacterium]TQI68512.1 CheY-like chemotaxis protein [Clostridium sp. KNHs216]